MSELKRYFAKLPWFAVETQEHPLGEFVTYRDYSGLKAEVENITDENDRLRKHLQKMGKLKAEVERLKVEADWKTHARRNKALEAKVEALEAACVRLTKAGDYLQRDVRLLSKDLLGKNPPIRHSEMEWNAAKGVQS